MTRSARAAGMSGSMASITPKRMPTSRRPRSDWLGSSTSPPLITRSYLSFGPMAANAGRPAAESASAAAPVRTRRRDAGISCPPGLQATAPQVTLTFFFPLQCGSNGHRSGGERGGYRFAGLETIRQLLSRLARTGRRRNSGRARQIATPLWIVQPKRVAPSRLLGERVGQDLAHHAG